MTDSYLKFHRHFYATTYFILQCFYYGKKGQDKDKYVSIFDIFGVYRAFGLKMATNMCNVNNYRVKMHRVCGQELAFGIKIEAPF